jgi:glycerol-3-phosphate acyltransferase PlsY
MVRVLCIVIGYLFGMIQTSFILGKIKGIDIREHGSGNAGTTNTLRVLGKKAGLIVFVGDLLKSIIALTLVRFLITPSYPEIKYLLLFYTGFGAVIGHNFPFYLKFKGGKGIAATGGMILSLHWIFVPFGLFFFFGTFFLTHYVSLGSLILYLTFFIEVVLFGQMGIFEATQPVLYEIYAVCFVMMAMAYWKHKDNIVRLLHHEERKTYLTKKNEI